MYLQKASSNTNNKMLFIRIASSSPGYARSFLLSRLLFFIAGTVASQPETKSGILIIRGFKNFKKKYFIKDARL